MCTMAFGNDSGGLINSLRFCRCGRQSPSSHSLWRGLIRTLVCSRHLMLFGEMPLRVFYLTYSSFSGMDASRAFNTLTGY